MVTNYYFLIVIGTVLSFSKLLYIIAYVLQTTGALRCLDNNHPNISNCLRPMNLSNLAHPDSLTSGGSSSSSFSFPSLGIGGMEGGDEEEEGETRGRVAVGVVGTGEGEGTLVVVVVVDSRC